MTPLLVTGIGLLVTNRPDVGTGPLGTVPDAWLLIESGRVAGAGPAGSLDLPSGVETMDVEGRCVLPGFVDAHTHLVYAGDRSDEFRRRLSGDSYESILEAGGGIHATVSATRAASVQELLDVSAARARRMLEHGTTTVEVKSGYGLDLDTEIRQLEVAARLPAEVGIDVTTTFLAHVIPSEYAARREDYVDLVVEEVLPRCSTLADACDVFCDRGAFSVTESRRILRAGVELGLGVRVHADQLARTGAARLAAEMGAISADHLDHVGPDDVAALRSAGTVAVLIPGAVLQMRTPPPPARALWDGGVPVALATDCNPGTSHIESMPFVVALGSLLLGLTVEESVWAATRGGALAIGRDRAGQLGPGAHGDLVVVDADHPGDLAYRPDTDLVHAVVKGGRIVRS